ncbi:MAG: glycosyltransferase family 2 protein [Planctomycetota bacterium]
MSDGIRVRHGTVVLGVPAYNEVRWISRTIASIQAQSHRDFAVLMADNASSDGTSDICADVARRDSRFFHIRHDSNRGAAFNFDFARDASESPYFGWVGAHDLLHADFLAVHLSALRQRSDAVGSFTYFEWIDSNDRTIQRDGDIGVATPQRGALCRYLWSIAIGSDLGPMHALFRRTLLPKLASRQVVAADHILLANMALYGPFIAQPGHLYRLRHFDESLREETSMQRITGKRNSLPNFAATIEAYLSDFDLMHPKGTSMRRWRPLVSWLLHDRLDRRSLRVTKRLRSLVKHFHRVRAWLRPRPTDQVHFRSN